MSCHRSPTNSCHDHIKLKMQIIMKHVQNLLLAFMLAWVIALLTFILFSPLLYLFWTLQLALGSGSTTSQTVWLLLLC